jgi:hypothetical protein
MGYRTSTALHVSSSSTGMQIQGYRSTDYYRVIGVQEYRGNTVVLG